MRLLWSYTLFFDKFLQRTHLLVCFILLHDYACENNIVSEYQEKKYKQWVLLKLRRVERSGKNYSVITTFNLYSPLLIRVWLKQ
jgi:hypothetical protein